MSLDFYMFQRVFYMFQSILSIFVFLAFFWLEKSNIFTDGGTPPPLAENFAKISNLIFEPFPKWLKYTCQGDGVGLTVIII